MTRLLSLCGGFLLAVLWFDLMFDTQVLGAPPGDLPEEILASIAAYYARVTTAAVPMNRLIGVVMLQHWPPLMQPPQYILEALAYQALVG